MANFSRVAEIFEQASVAFGRLAQLTLDLKQFQAQQNDGDSKTCGKWSQKEVEDLKDAIGRFGSDLSKVAEAIETKTINQIKQKLKTRAFQDAGLGDISLENEAVDTETKPKATTPNATPVERGRRKQALNQMSEPVDMHPPKRSRSNVDDLNEYTNYASEVEVQDKKSNQPASNNKSYSNENVTPQKNDDGHNILKQKPVGSTLSSVLSKPISLARSDVSNFDDRHRKTTTPVNVIGSGYSANESKYEDYDSDDSDYDGADGGGGRTPGEDYESDEEQEEEEEEEEEADDNEDYDE
ncbi:hypothetical protein Smp_088660 [Schistosoma mansoni]|uniref:SANT domain-containing protein n=1 Tax=Schistosoma mansoni TaxID=6183 RepID=G4VDP8_SCHMA|nr:hypothetical protein Smp_088660 [Schistosoma mansoni]|eukprot:XP_018649609.1 hypothetical protein Smp_088660 [Schistosoma mansoni]